MTDILHVSRKDEFPSFSSSHHGIQELYACFHSLLFCKLTYVSLQLEKSEINTSKKLEYYLCGIPCLFVRNM